MSPLLPNPSPCSQHQPVDTVSQPIRILIADAHPVIQQGIQKILEAASDMTIVAEAQTGAQVVKLALLFKPDVILMDVVMPEMDGLEAIARIHASIPDVHILVFTCFSTDEQIFSAIKAGALGYILKSCSSEEIIAAIRQVARGKPSFDSAITRKVLEEFANPTKQAQPEHSLSKREEKILRLVAQGLRNKEIAQQLVISEKTVRDHVSSILAKLHLVNRTQVALFAVHNGFISPESDDQQP